LPKPARWGQERRLEFIDFRLYWSGRINRSDLVDFFSVSVPQASLDLARYREIAPQNIEYDPAERAYVARSEFSPIIAPKEADAYLNQVLGLELGILQPNMTFVGSPVDAAAIRNPCRNVDASVLRIVLQAIRSVRILQIKYQSMTRAFPSERTISPHAIAFDGSRWHVRAFCHEHEDFRDFVFARILDIALRENSTIDPSSDILWKREIEVIIRPNPELTQPQRTAIELDFGMTNGRLALSVREALLFYFLKHLRLLPSTNGISEHIVLANGEELAPFFADHGLAPESK
jgi:hypothetical protein